MTTRPTEPTAEPTSGPGPGLDASACPSIETAMTLLGRAWAGAVMQALLDGHERFRDLRRAVPGITDAVLTARLRELCERGFAVRRVDAGPPTRVTYALTDAGRDVEPVLVALQAFAEQHHDLLGPNG